MKKLFLPAVLLSFSLTNPASAQVLLLPTPDIYPMLDAGADPMTQPDALIWLAQSTEEGYEAPDNGKRRGSKGSSLNTGVTKGLVAILNKANGTCGSTKMEARYRIDCLRIYYGWVADELPDTGDYAPIKKAMRRAEAKLDAIVKANLDTSEPAIEPREGYKSNAKRMPPVRAVKKSATRKAAAQAAAVVQEAELVIVRSGEDPSRRKPHFTEVAAAVEDNLVILRSA